MSLLDLDLHYKYRSDFDRIYEDFYEKCLQESCYYDRAAGYFSSESLRLIARGLESFLYNDGKIRIIANPYLQAADLEAIVKGYEAKEAIIEKSLLRELEITAKTIEEDTLNILAWLIYEEQLEIRIAFTENNALYHEKFGLFKDRAGNCIAFSGSANETAGGIQNNFEKIDVFLPPKDNHRIQDTIEDFEKLWEDETNGLIIKKMSRYVKDMILSYRKENKPPARDPKGRVPKPRPYQQLAIDKLIRNNWQGILEMATGTGKTITSLLAMDHYKNVHKRAFCIIIAPFKHLVDQWYAECKPFGGNFATLCYESTAKWLPELESEVRNFNIGITDFHVVITTYDTAKTKAFLTQIQKLQQHAVLIADECHYLGSPKFRDVQLNNIQVRIGLSATPDRWWDDEGTAYLKAFFNDVVYTYSLDKAIEEEKLTPYKYYPQVVSLTDVEMNRYNALTLRIIKHFNSKERDEELLSQLNRQRALILSKAEQKIPKLIELLQEKGIEQISHTIVYCAENQVNILTQQLSVLGLRVHKFDSTVPTKERRKLLMRFADAEIQVLIAIKCLDEGVDVPSTKCAYFLASTSNPREFVQRRGRILRTYEGKHFAEIYDFIVFPTDVEEPVFTSIAKKELPRFAEFANSSLTASQAKNTIMPYISPYNLNHLMDMKPWDVYKEMKEEFEHDRY